MKSNKLLSFLMSGLVALTSSGAVSNVLAMGPVTPTQDGGETPAPPSFFTAFAVNCKQCGKQPVPDTHFALYCQESITKWHSYFCPRCLKPVEFGQIEGAKEVLDKLAKLNTAKLVFVKGVRAFKQSPLVSTAAVGTLLATGTFVGIPIGYAIGNSSAKKELRAVKRGQLDNKVNEQKLARGR